MCTEGSFIGFRPRREAMYKRINEFAKALPDGYKGSRSMPDRFMWQKTTLACFIELRETPNDLASLLFAVKGVRTVVSMTSHVIVFSKLFPDEAGFQFLLSDKSHVRDKENMPETFSLCYTRQADNVHALEAWRILREAVQGMELHKEIVNMLDIEFKNALGPGSASSAISLTSHKRLPLPPLPHVSSLEENLARDIAQAYTLKLTDKDAFQTAKNRGMVEIRSDLAVRAGLILFQSESSKVYIRHHKFLANPTEYESSPGYVYCDAGNGIYARLVDERIGAICEHNRKVEHLCTDMAKGDLLEVVLYQYRYNSTPRIHQALVYLQRLIESALESVHGASKNEPEEEEEEEQQSESEQSEKLELESVVDWDGEASNYDKDESLVDWDGEDSNYDKDAWDRLNEEEAKSFEEEQCRNFKDDMKDHFLMMEFKNKAPPASVRWRALPFKQGNDFLQNSMQVMIELLVPRVSSLWKHLWEPANFTTNSDQFGQALPTTTPHAACKQFLGDARRRSISGVKSWSEDPEILEHKEHFFSSLPLSSEELFKDFTRMSAVQGLIDLHNGEIVEVPTDNTERWTLTYVNGMSGLNDLPDQFQKGQNFRVPTLNHYDKNNIRMSIVKTLLHLRKYKFKIDHDDLQPHWEEQWNRLCVPCKGTKRFAWLRTGSVMTLGELFRVLHHKYTCREIYVLYLHLDIVSLKRKKDPPKGKQTSAHEEQMQNNDVRPKGKQTSARGKKRKNNDTW